MRTKWIYGTMIGYKKEHRSNASLGAKHIDLDRIGTNSNGTTVFAGSASTASRNHISSYIPKSGLVGRTISIEDQRPATARTSWPLNR